MKKQQEIERTGWPIPFAGFSGLTPADIPREVSSGITLAALVIPLNIGYAQVAGLPPAVGLGAGMIPLAIFALFTSSRHVVASPDASIAALLGAALLGATAASDELRVQYALAIALMCCLFFFIFWFFRLAFLANFLSRPVLVGFFSGLGIEVFTNQARKILGVSAEHLTSVEALAEKIHDSLSFETEGYFQELIELIASIPNMNYYTLTIGVVTLILVRVLKKRTPKLPGAFIALVLMTIIVAVFNLDERGVGILGDISISSPSISFPHLPFAEWLNLMPAALAIASITLCEGLMLARRYSRKYNYKADGNQLLFAFGLANLTAGAFGSLVLGNSTSRAAAMDNAGAKSPLPCLAAAGIVAIAVYGFSEMLAYLPNAALAGVVANAVLSLIEVSELKELHRMRRSDFYIALICLLSVLVLGPLRAVIIAFLFSTIEVVRRSSNPSTSVLQESRDGTYLVPGETDATQTASELIIYRFEAPLYFANANLFMEEVEHLITQPSKEVKWFVLDAQAITDIDTTGADVLREVLDLLSAHDIVFALSRANERFTSLLEHYELVDEEKEIKCYATNRQAVAEYYSDKGPSTGREAGLVSEDILPTPSNS